MITRLRIQGFRGIADETIEFGPLTVLVGRNGAGKSAVIDALRFIRDALFDGLENAVSRRGGFDAIRHHSFSGNAATSVRFSVDFMSDVMEGTYAFAFGPDRSDEELEYSLIHEQYETRSNNPNLRVKFANLSPTETPVHLGPGIQAFYSVLTLPEGGPDSKTKAHQAIRRLLRGNYHHLFSGHMREPRPASRERILSDDAANLTTVLREMQRAKDGGAAKRAILDDLGRIVPDVHDFRVDESRFGHLEAGLFHGPATDGARGNGSGGSTVGTWLGLHQESDGTLRALATLAALYQDVPPSYGGPLSLEEPENALHPGALAVLADAIRETATRRQVILTTQSPDLIARFRADELRVVERVDGATRVGPLAEHQRAAIEQELFGAGDLLRIEGLQREPVTPPADAVPSPTPTGDAAA